MLVVMCSITSCFRYNDHPHGLFGLIQSQQVINVDPSDLVRSILLNFTRHEGSFGSVILTFAIGYDIVSFILSILFDLSCMLYIKEPPFVVLNLIQV